PPLALQAVFDPAAMVRNRRIIAVGTLLPTLYFSSVDALAIRSGIWELHAATRTGLEIGNLPLEEALFFFTTSLLLAQGLLLWHTLFQRADA
ncbi:MAG: lycopene cyclase domain-containing protein, partial [Opitutales bacterium]